MNDIIADTIVRLKNAASAGKETVSVSYSKIGVSTLGVLKDEGYITDFEVKGKKIPRSIDVVLRNDSGKPVIEGTRRISRPSKRVYVRFADIRPVRNGLGHLIVSTSLGVMTGRKARKEKVGGEPLFEIW